mgnify:CR=1 FL=1
MSNNIHRIDNMKNKGERRQPEMQGVRRLPEMEMIVM